MRHLDLFSGIGGFALAASWVWGDDHEIVSFCEIEPYCQKVLKKHWPDVPINKDVRTIKGDEFGTINIVTGGFPCQDLSCSGKQAGINGERSGLWGELCRITSVARPNFLIVENVANLLTGGNGEWFAKVLFDLASIGYDAEWHCIPASAVGAPHVRDRVWVVSYPQGKYGETMQKEAWPLFRRIPTQLRGVPCWETEPRICRVDDGLSEDVDKRNKGLGNAIVPQVVVPIMQAIKEIEEKP